jgi:uncharacterized RDD family membrane protein YckC
MQPLNNFATPSLKRRLASMLYEAMLLFGVVFIAGWLFDTLSQSRHALTLRHARQFWLFLVLGAYFIFFWCRSGQTLAMKTWRIKLVDRTQTKISFGQASARYLLAWMWFLPAMALDYVFGLKGWSSLGLIALGMVLWMMTILFNKDRQFLHDRLAGTRLVTFQVVVKQAALTESGTSSS